MAKRANADASFPVLAPDLQVSFYYRLQSMRSVCLREALQSAVGSIRLPVLDAELNHYVPDKHLRKLATFGIRGEVIFPVPVVLAANPFLLGYYRLLLGHSQKAFFNKGPFGRFKVMEDRGEVPPTVGALVPPLCQSLIGAASQLVDGVDDISLQLVHDLQLLTLGPQMRGSENTKIGDQAVKQVFDVVRTIVADSIVDETPRSLVVSNATGRKVFIEFGADPDIRITEKLPTSTRTILSVEIKGGSDASNIHNRLGEAEKSHIKAKKLGCNEFWTILRVDLPAGRAAADSPTTTEFFNLGGLADRGSIEFKRFREQLTSRIGI